MKKLMTMLAAVATAFGLYAADSGFISGAGFDSTDTNGTEKLTWTSPAGFVDGYWTGADKASIVAEKYTYAGTHPAQFDDDSGRDYDQYLKIDSTGALVSQSILPGGSKQEISAEKGLYFDGLVQFTAFDEMPTIASDAKIALFPMLKDAEDESKGASLWIKSFGTAVTNLWTTDADIAIDGNWHRVTIKMINNIKKAGETAQVGFVVYVDGQVVTSTDAKTALDPDKLTSEAKYFYKDGKLFGSLGDSAEMTEVAFGGKGAIDEIAFTETAPSFAASPKFAYLKGATNIASFEFDGKTWTPAGDPLEVMLVGTDSDTVLVENIEASEGFFPVKTSDNVEVTAGATSDVGEAKQLGATVVINDVPVYFETAAAALAELNDTSKYAAATTAELTLNAAESGAITLNNANITLTLDLAGKKIAAAEGDAAAINVTAGALTIVDSSNPQKGTVAGFQPVEGDPINAVKANGTGVTVNIGAGIYDGKVAAAKGKGTIAITDGKFRSPDNTKETLDGYAPAGKEFTLDGDYFVLAVKKVKAIWIVDGVATTNLVDYNTVPTKPEDPVKTGYTFTGWDKDTTAAITADTEYTAQFTIQQFTVSYTTNNVVEPIATEQVNYQGKPANIPDDLPEGTWDVDPNGAVITCDTNFNYTVTAQQDWPTPPAKDEDVEKTMKDAGFTDEVAACFPTVESYTTLMSWAQAQDLTAADIADNSAAQLAFAAGAATADADVTLKIDTMAAAAEAAGTFDLTIVVPGNKIVNKELLATLITVQGATKIGTGADWSAEKTDITAGTPVEGKVSVKVTPAEDYVDSPAFFMQVAPKE